MVLTDNSEIGALAESPLSNDLRAKIQSNRAWVNMGFRTRPLGTITIQVTGGDDVTDTYVVKDAGVAIMAAVGWAVSHNATAAAIAVAINAFRDANPTVSNWVATAAADTITLRQVRSGVAGTITVTVVGDAVATPANSGNVSNDTDTWTEFVSGATFDGDLYYELGWSGALAILPGQDLTNARISHAKFYCDGQAFQLWSGGLRANAAATALVQGIPVASVTWTEWLPWLDADVSLIIKVASDEEVLAMAKII